MYYMGVDVGSVSTDIALIDNNYELIEKIYLRTKGNPIKAVQEGFKILKNKYEDSEIYAVGTTGSGRMIASAIIGADVVKNEITAHATAALEIDKDVKTIIEIGGQDSKIIIINNGIVVDFAMNTVCAAGTGSFLDRQAERLGLEIGELGDYALRAGNPVRIAGRCAVFAESDIIHKQQIGYTMEDIIAGMSRALVRNYMSNVAKGKEILPKVCFQGGVAANAGIRRALEEALGCDIVVPEYHKVMGAFGAAVLAQELMEEEKKKTRFKGFEAGQDDIRTETFECADCSNHCEVVILRSGGRQIGCFSDRCGKYQTGGAGIR